MFEASRLLGVLLLRAGGELIEAATGVLIGLICRDGNPLKRTRRLFNKAEGGGGEAKCRKPQQPIGTESFIGLTALNFQPVKSACWPRRSLIVKLI